MVDFVVSGSRLNLETRALRWTQNSSHGSVGKAPQRHLRSRLMRAKIAPDGFVYFRAGENVAWVVFCSESYPNGSRPTASAQR